MADKTLSAEDVRALGIIQEVNRLLLHPMGLALAVVWDSQDAGFNAHGAMIAVVDVRDDPEGMYFEYAGDHRQRLQQAQAKRYAFAALAEGRARPRRAALGFFVQPLRTPSPNHPLAFREGDTDRGRSCLRCGLKVPGGYKHPHDVWCEEHGAAWREESERLDAAFDLISSGEFVSMEALPGTVRERLAASLVRNRPREVLAIHSDNLGAVRRELEEAPPEGREYVMEAPEVSDET